MLKKVVPHESGQALVWTLVILGVGALLIPALLSYINTNLLASRTIEEGLKEQYAADAGVEYALRRLADDDCPDVPFDTPTAVNKMPVTVTVESEGDYYKITSTAKDTVISSYVEYSPGGNLDLYKGALVSSGNIQLDKDCIVDGDIRYGGQLTHHGQLTLYGEEITGTIEFPPSDEFAQTYKDEALVGGTHTGDLDICTGTLGPKYIADGNLTVGAGCVVTLTGTIYVDGYILVGNEGTFAGVGSIVAVGNIDMQKVANFGTGSDSVIMSVNGDIKFWKDATVEALIYAPNGSIIFKKEGNVTGAVVAANIEADKLNLFAYDASFYDGIRLPGYEDPGFRVRTYNIDP